MPLNEAQKDLINGSMGWCLDFSEEKAQFVAEVKKIQAAFNNELKDEADEMYPIQRFFQHPEDFQRLEQTNPNITTAEIREYMVELATIHITAGALKNFVSLQSLGWDKNALITNIRSKAPDPSPYVSRVYCHNTTDFEWDLPEICGLTYSAKLIFNTFDPDEKQVDVNITAHVPGKPITKLIQKIRSIPDFKVTENEKILLQIDILENPKTTNLSEAEKNKILKNKIEALLDRKEAEFTEETMRTIRPRLDLEATTIILDYFKNPPQQNEENSNAHIRHNSVEISFHDNDFKFDGMELSQNNLDLEAGDGRLLVTTPVSPRSITQNSEEKSSRPSIYIKPFCPGAILVTRKIYFEAIAAGVLTPKFIHDLKKAQVNNLLDPAIYNLIEKDIFSIEQVLEFNNAKSELVSTYFNLVSTGKLRICDIQVPSNVFFLKIPNVINLIRSERLTFEEGLVVCLKNINLTNRSYAKAMVKLISDPFYYEGLLKNKFKFSFFQNLTASQLSRLLNTDSIKALANTINPTADIILNLAKQNSPAVASRVSFFNNLVTPTSNNYIRMPNINEEPSSQPSPTNRKG